MCQRGYDSIRIDTARLPEMSSDQVFFGSVYVYRGNFCSEAAACCVLLSGEEERMSG